MIRFSKYSILYFLISGFVIVPGIYTMFTSGFRRSIDFTGGTVAEFRFDKNLASDDIAQRIEKLGATNPSVEESRTNSVTVRLRPEESSIVELIPIIFMEEASVTAALLRTDTVGPTLGSELLGKAITAAIVSIIAILGYVAYSFKNIKYGVSAIIALFHDLLVVLGVFSMLGKYAGVEIDTLFVTAFLTTMSFSVHDTIVVFDRIREYLRKGDKRQFEDVVDTALTETMNRSIVNSVTIMLMLLALVLFGGETIKYFALALLIGTISGTYSSPFIAAPVLMLWHRFEQKKKSI